MWAWFVCHPLDRPCTGPLKAPAEFCNSAWGRDELGKGDQKISCPCQGRLSCSLGCDWVSSTEIFLTAVVPEQNCLSKHLNNEKNIVKVHKEALGQESFAARSKRITLRDAWTFCLEHWDPAGLCLLEKQLLTTAPCRSFPCYNSHSGLELKPVYVIWQSFSPDLSSWYDFRYLIFARANINFHFHQLINLFKLKSSRLHHSHTGISFFAHTLPCCV